ncbi:hypothetical protein H4Q26_015198 [Puccinia striiformis f. sp. tritici PST-130]|nr:hypothetical protein H4Q26_015198 [Puccinia striiformis f. sp. tritici PST-130]
MYGRRRCWNTASSSNPLKRKNTSPLDLSKRLACHSINDVSQNSNLIDLRLTSELVYSSEFLPDHQSARTSDNHHSSSKKKNTSVSHSNHRIESSLIDRITLPFQNQNQTVQVLYEL